jgi:hypothetical protein
MFAVGEWVRWVAKHRPWLDTAIGRVTDVRPNVICVRFVGQRSYYSKVELVDVRCRPTSIDLCRPTEEAVAEFMLLELER